MCGIAGFSNYGTREDISSMVDSLKHRGPDESGIYYDKQPNLFLGHTRLSIIDIQGGKQPMHDEHDSLVVVFNGEIYNFLELRKELTAKGYIFKSSHSDTEVLVNGYKEWGADLFEKLNGMFAFAIYDRKNKCIILARDRFGEKPLYYFFNNRMFAFASELSSLTLHSNIPKTVNNVALQKYFGYGYIPAPMSIYKDCYKVEPGGYVTFNLNNNSLQKQKHFQFMLDPINTKTNENDLVEELDHLFSSSIKHKLMSDVPLGVFLSGGIDSSAVLAYASDYIDKGEIHTFTVGFDEASFDESSYADQMAKQFGTIHNQKILDLDDIKQSCYDILDRLDEPMSDPSILPTFALSKHTSQYVKVALSGDGGDEMFAGYDTFDALAVSKFYNSFVPSLLHKTNLKLANLLPMSFKNMSFDFKVKKALSGLSYPQSLWNPIWLSPLLPEEIKELFDEPIYQEEIYSEVLDLWDKTKHLDLVDKTMMFYTNFYLPGNVLTKVDRASMMNSLETRAVFLDNDIANFCMTLPNHFKYKNGTKKYILKKLLEKKLPKSILERKKKGFGVPIAKWLMEFPNHVPLNKLQGINTNISNHFWDQHRTRKKDRRLFLWSWLVLQRFILK